jgi:two-component system NtrC family sensor kinase
MEYLFMKEFESSFDDSTQLEEVFNLAARVAINGKWLSVNSMLCQILGYSKDTFLQLTFLDITHPEDKQADQALVNQLITGARQEYRREKRYLHKTAVSYG